MSLRKTVTLGLVLVLGAGLLPGCRSMSSGGQGALIGGLVGAGAGHAIGHHRGNRTNHALAGGLVGAMAGYIIGDAIDDRDRDRIGGPETIQGSDERYHDDGSRYVVRRRVYYGTPADEPACDDPRW
jgi:outer membrane lipoprotein SlyB